MSSLFLITLNRLYAGWTRASTKGYKKLRAVRKLILRLGSDSVGF